MLSEISYEKCILVLNSGSQRYLDACLSFVFVDHVLFCSVTFMGHGVYSSYTNDHSAVFSNIDYDVYKYVSNYEICKFL